MVEYIHKIELRLTRNLFKFPREMRRSDLRNIEFGSFNAQVFVRPDV